MLNLQTTAVKMWTFKLRVLKIQIPEVSHVNVEQEGYFDIGYYFRCFQTVSYLTLRSCQCTAAIVFKATNSRRAGWVQHVSRM
jgi:hypothetical protein